MYTIADIENYFKQVAALLVYISHVPNTQGATNRYARFDDAENANSEVGKMGFPRLILKGLPSGAMSGNAALLSDRLTMSIEIINNVRKDDFNHQSEIWNETRLACQQIVAAIQKAKNDGSCTPLEKHFDFNSVRYELVKDQSNNGWIAGTQMTFALTSYAPTYDSAQWQ